MKKTISLALSAIFALSSVSTLSSSAQVLWKVEKPGNNHTTYILGTHHFAPVSMLDSIPSINDVIKNSDRVYGELDMAVSTSPEAMMGMQQYLVAPADSTLDKVLTTQQLDSVKTVWNHLTGGQAPLEMMYAMKPATLSTQIAAIMAMQIFPELNPLEGLDMTMQNRAKEFGKPVAGLETMDFQMKMLYGRPIAKQAEGLMKTIADIDTEEVRAKELAQAYMNQDLDAILKAMIEEESDPEEYEQILYSRNDNWVRQLLQEMPNESLTVVVGAGHLPGERGVLQQLKNAGYTVSPVK